MLAVIGAVMAWELRPLISESVWYVAPIFAVLVFAGILHAMLQRPGSGSRRRALLFGVATVASLATAAFAAFGYTFIRLVRGGAQNLEVFWICSGVAAGALSAWLWLKFFRLLRQP